MLALRMNHSLPGQQLRLIPCDDANNNMQASARHTTTTDGE